jgi:hypothetical protein
MGMLPGALANGFDAMFVATQAASPGCGLFSGC